MSLAFIQVLSVENEYHSSCISISTEKYRFLIDVGEGTQRLVVEHKVRLGKIACVLLTSGVISSLGGLPGMLLTLDDAGVSSVQVMCPPEAQKYMQSTQYFMRSLGSYNIITPQNTLQPTDFDELVFSPVLIQLSSMESRVCYIGETAVIAGKFDIQKAAELKIPKGPLYGKLKGGMTVQLDDGRVITPDQVVGEATPSQYFAIVCKVDESNISNLIDQTVWSNYMTDNKDNHSKYFTIMIHLSASSVTSTVLYQSWLQRFPQTTQHIFIGKQDSITTTSFLASALYNSQLFTLFGNNFTDLLHQSTAQPALTNLASNQIIGETLFKFHLLPIKKKGSVEVSYQSIIQSLRDNCQTFRDEALKYYPYLTDLIAKKNEILALNTNNAKREEDYYFYFLGTGCAIPSRYRNVSSFLLYLPATDSAIVLDCGEATWFQLMYLQPPSSSSSSRLDQAHAQRWAEVIKMVWISHPHADHHLGLVNLILKRRELIPPSTFTPLLVIAPMNVYCYLRDVSTIYDDLSSSFVFFPCNYFDSTETCPSCTTVQRTISTQIPTSTVIRPEENSLDDLSKIINDNDVIEGRVVKRSKSMFLSYSAYYEDVLANPSNDLFRFLENQLLKIGIHSLVNIPVIHCRQSYGLILQVELPREADGAKRILKIVYSGDTRPCDGLIFLGKDADILIHEATFEDDKYPEAVSKKHSTIAEAMEVGELMNCSAIILTHFSQRYHGVPLQFHPKGANPLDLVAEQLRKGQEEGKRVLLPIIAFDFMRIGQSDLKWLPYLTSPIAEMFAKDEELENEDSKLV